MTTQSKRGIEGRWKLCRDGNAIVAYGDFPPENVMVDAVPCDADAIERVAWEMASIAGCAFIFSDHRPEGASAESAREGFRRHARRVLRAAKNEMR